MTSMIDDYEPLEIIGNGSFGVIRKVKRRSDGVLFARKELNFERMTDRDRKQIVAEVNILKDIKHENIVRYINRHVDHDSRILYILMEYCGGGDLGAIISSCRRQNRALPEEQIWNYFVQMVLALHYCHFPGSRGQPDVTAPIEPSASHKQILHRDLKPENVFLSTDNEIKLGDFGLSKQIATAAFASTYVGTPYYMSPELMSEKAYDTKSDIWSLGCMVYEMCALRAPFHDAQTYNELATAIRSGRIPPLPKGYSSALSSVIRSMLNLNPAMRPSTLQLLKIEQLMYAKKLIDVNKMVPEIRSKHDAIIVREKAATAREQAVGQREAAAVAREEELAAQRAEVQAQREHLDVDQTQLTIRKQQLEADIAHLEKARAEMAQARAEFDAQVMQAKQAYELFAAQRDAFIEEKSQWEQQVLSRMTSAPLVDDIKNKPTVLRSSRYTSEDETPTKALSDFTSRVRLESGDDTPSKAAFSRRQQPTVASIPSIPPAAVLRLQPQPAPKFAFLSSPPPSAQPQETPRRLTSSRSMTDLGSAMKGIILTDTGDVMPTPIRREPSSRGQSLDLDRGVESDGAYSAPETSLAAAERQRMPRRRSIVIPSGAAATLPPPRPTIPASATTSAIPRVPSGTASGAGDQPAGPSSSASTSTSSSSISAISRTGPVWDHENEENLPSPFIKRNVDFSSYARSASTVASTLAANLAGKTSSGNLASKPRSSMISKALKASGEAQKALARRQAEGKTSIS